MMRTAALFLAAVLALSAPGAAQDRIRSPDYTGEEAIEPCFDWQTGFEFLRCERLPIPGQTGMMGQTYTLDGGARRTLTEDPRITAGNIDPLAMAADDGSGPTAEVTGTGAPQDRAAVAPATGSTTESIIAGGGTDAAGSGLTDAGGTDADEGDTPRSKIVEEVFDLPPVVAVFPGRAEILPMATAHLNRIETPFSDPMVRTSAQADALNVEFDQNYIYVSVTQPVTLFIHQRGYPDPAVVVSLVPQRISPRQVKLAIPPSMTAQVKKNQAVATAAASGTDAAAGPKTNSAGIRRASPSGAATGSLAHLIQTFAKGRVPKGFKSVSVSAWSTKSFCRTTGGARFTFEQGAAVASNDYVIVRGMVTASRKISLDERVCALNPETLAVAFSPRTEVGPDHPTDFFVLMRRPGAPIQSVKGG